jgi:hypothetical protein
MRESKLIWPLVLFPFVIDNAHTRTYTGRCWVKDIKATFSFAEIKLTTTNLTCRSRLFNFLIFNLSLPDIEEIKSLENKPGLILIKYRSAEFGKLARFSLSGQPPGSKNQVILNVKNEQRWLNKFNLSRT